MVTPKMGKYKALDIANYFLLKADQEEQEFLSNLKLQKLIYYAQGLHLIIHGEPLFNDKIVAWQYGPVVPDLYHQFKNYGSQGIPADREFNPSIIDKKTKDFLDEIYEIFGQFSAVQLMRFAHEDKCWIDAGIGNEITLDSMKICLKKYLKDG